MKRYRFIDHTADLGIIAYGRDEKELFANIAYALFDNIADLGTVQKNEVVEVKVKGMGWEELLLNWLRELLYLQQVKDYLFKRFVLRELEESHLIGDANGERFDPQRHRLKIEVKAVTYHQLKVEKNRAGWQAQVIFDI
ncbi:MAG: archease [Deltaproteobacteria bacterium]|nr:MAG: archease [Deltaproteobacteria bacterium]